MRRFLQVLSMICVFGANLAFAQSGAVVYKEQQFAWWFYYDGAGLLSVHSSDRDFYCAGEPIDFYLTDILAVFRPDESVKFKSKGHYFTRVFYPVTPEEFFGDWSDEVYCASVNSLDYLVAEGITHHVFNDNSYWWGPLHRGRNTYGHTWSGTLTDLTGTCDSGMADFVLLIKLQLEKNADVPACLPDCEILRKWKGPELACTD